MMDRSIKRLSKKARRGMRGYPVGTVAFYGPDDKRATKVAVGIKFAENTEPEMRTWFVEAGDARNDSAIAAEVLAYFEANGVLSVAMVDRIFGCPPQEGINYEGEYCPVCTFWIGRDRYTGKKVRAASLAWAIAPPYTNPRWCRLFATCLRY
jgi:hypothetical protein